MNDLIKAGDSTWYMLGWGNIGFYLQDDKNVYVIDTGSSNESGKRISDVIEEMGWNLKGILITHAHIDHIGGNVFLKKKYDCPIFANGSEAYVVRKNWLEPILYYGGLTYEEIRDGGVYSMDDIECFDVKDEKFPSEVEVIDLRGHSYEGVGFIMPDGTVFVGDAVFNEDAAEKYPMQYNYNMDEVFESYERLKSCGAKLFVPGHGEMFTDIETICETDKKTILDVGDKILELLEKPMSMEEILKSLFEHYNMHMNYRTNTLIFSIVKTYISWFKDAGRIVGSFDDNIMRWRRL